MLHAGKHKLTHPLFLKSIVFQVSVKSHGGRSSNIPFALLIRDPSSHIDTLSENKKLADNVSNSQNGKEEPADYKFNILIPKLEAYFPVMKYKCTGDLRPVPIVSCVRFLCCILADVHFSYLYRI